MERLPHGRHHQHSRRPAAAARDRAGRRPLSAWTRLTVVTGALALASVALPAGIAGAATQSPASGTPSLKVTLAKAQKLANEIEKLGQQYDSLQIQLRQARRQARLSRLAAARYQKLVSSGQKALGQIAAQGYMNGSLDPTLQMLQTSNPQQFLDQTSIMLQLQQENGDKLSQVSTAEQAARKAQLAAAQQDTQAARLSSQMRKKVAKYQAKQKVLDSTAYKQALDIYNETGKYPDISITGNSLQVQALRAAMTRVGDPYVWAAAGPSAFDCSGLVVWAYAQLGISLPHYTGDLWNSGVHVARSDLQPGDLVFFYGLDHVGFYVGNGLFLDAPQTGQDVQVQPMLWSVYDGAVRIG
ncbi:MAG TPA: C40 family peptidase [Streptosporangiaceae bacterium]|nr:C40 family peptidase [Streptosporangiaceae bacterium]